MPTERQPLVNADIARRDARVPLLVGLGVACFGMALTNQLAFLAPALCVAVGATSGALFGFRVGMRLSLFATVMYLSAAALQDAWTLTTTVTGLLTVVAGAGLGRAADLRRQLQRQEAQQRAAQSSLETLQRDERALFAVLPDVVCCVDRAGTVQASYGLVEDSAKTKEQVSVGRNVAELLPQGVARRALESVQAVLSQHDATTFDFQLGGQRPRHFEARLVPSGAHEVLALVRDVSALRQIEHDLNEAHRDALSAAGTKGRFLATMSHRIRTPMNGVIGMTNVLLQTRLTPEQREYTTIIRNSGEALLSILDNVLDNTHVDHGQMTLLRAPFGLRELLDELVELLAARAHAKGLEIASLIDARVPAWVQGDRGRLRQVIINLLGNAIKFTRQGHVALRAAVVGHERDTALIRFDVSDTGVGIPAEYQKNLFQDYGQANATVGREFGGTGLGLAISRQIVELMGGRMVVESGAGSGSTFSFTARFTTIQDRTTRSFVLPRSLGGAHILSLPLHPLTHELIEHQLSPLGAKIVVADTAETFACAFHDRGPFDVILVELPLSAGPDEADQVVHEASRVVGNVPILVLCTLGRRSVIERARQAGAACVLTRPLRRSSLYDGLVSLLGLTSRPATKRRAAEPEEAKTRDLQARVLVAEDNLVNQKVAVRTLELLGCHVEVVENGALAIETLKLRDFDAVLMDCQMPVLDGFEATRQLRLMEEGSGRHTPVIAVTANAMQGDRDLCLAAGMDDYLAKPVTMDALSEALQKWLPDRVTLEGRRESQNPALAGKAGTSTPNA